MTALARLMSDFNDLQSDPELNVSVNISRNNYFIWEGTLYGPADSPFENASFRFEINFPSDYPSNPPLFCFKTPIYHPNVGTYGTVCHPIFNRSWNSSCTPKAFISYIIVLLNEPNPSSGYGNEATAICKQDINLWRQKARDKVLEVQMNKTNGSA